MLRNEKTAAFGYEPEFISEIKRIMTENDVSVLRDIHQMLLNPCSNGSLFQRESGCSKMFHTNFLLLLCLFSNGLF